MSRPAARTLAYSDHALRRMAERDISARLVELTIAQGTRKLNWGRAGTEVYELTAEHARALSGAAPPAGLRVVLARGYHVVTVTYRRPEQLPRRGKARAG